MPTAVNVALPASVTAPDLLTDVTVPPWSVMVDVSSAEISLIAASRPTNVEPFFNVQASTGSPAVTSAS
ncbi:hypothetical protein [Stenotrophomonas maltophilia]|uniref:hypothetical protein n=1 Tax=Stenotrophomonas maltophilia TaxID=40324 RepID=UPI001EF8E940|nr:hypothetical protein [Stenotrophomonas maltophilia]